MKTHSNHGKGIFIFLNTIVSYVFILYSNTGISPPDLKNKKIHISGEIRYRGQIEQGETWGPIVEDNNGYHLWRVHSKAESKFSETIKALVELKSAYDFGRKFGSRAFDREPIDFLQAHLELKPPDSDIKAKLGRQYLHFGNERLISFLGGPNSIPSFDALKFSSDQSWGSLHGFIGEWVEFDKKPFHNQSIEGQRIMGLRYQYPINKTSIQHAETALLYFRGKSHNKGQKVNTAKEISLSHRFIWSFSNITSDLEVIFQTGKVEQSNIMAYALLSDWKFKSKPSSPLTLTLKAGHYSGDSDLVDATRQSFRPPFPKGAHFSELGVFGPSNLSHIVPKIHYEFHPKLNFSLGTTFNWKSQRADYAYNLLGHPLTSHNSPNRYLGHEIQTTLNYSPSKQTSFLYLYSQFQSGQYLREAGLNQLKLHLIQVEFKF